MSLLCHISVKLSTLLNEYFKSIFRLKLSKFYTQIGVNFIYSIENLNSNFYTIITSYSHDSIVLRINSSFENSLNHVPLNHFDIIWSIKRHLLRGMRTNICCIPIVFFFLFCCFDTKR